ncbi:MAG TPA: KH domain-containing protein [Solirubrobacteraceae bacterium]|nr:KH domain-containing protein [Solirubrobacteraceae bacterium]
MASEIPRRLLEYLAEGLVDDPDAVSVEQFEEGDGTIVLELCVGPEDYGRVIGRGGRTAHALRTVVKAAAAGEGCHVLLDIVD